MRFLEILKPGLWGKSLGFWGIPFSKAFSLLLNPLYIQYQLLIIQRNHLGCSRCSPLNFLVFGQNMPFRCRKKTIYSPPHSLACRVKFVKQFIPSLTPVLCVAIFFVIFLILIFNLGFTLGCDWFSSCSSTDVNCPVCPNKVWGSVSIDLDVTQLKSFNCPHIGRSWRAGCALFCPVTSLGEWSCSQSCPSTDVSK